MFLVVRHMFLFGNPTLLFGNDMLMFGTRFFLAMTCFSFDSKRFCYEMECFPCEHYMFLFWMWHVPGWQVVCFCLEICLVGKWYDSTWKSKCLFGDDMRIFGTDMFLLRKWHISVQKCNFHVLAWHVYAWGWHTYLKKGVELAYVCSCAHSSVLEIESTLCDGAWRKNKHSAGGGLRTEEVSKPHGREGRLVGGGRRCGWTVW